MSRKHNHNKFLNNKFNMLTVIEFIEIRKVQHKDRIRNKYYYKCMCDCGKSTIVSTSCLAYTQSCGCIFKEANKRGHVKQRGVARPFMQKPNGESVLHTFYLSCKNAAKKRKIDFKLTEKEYDEITKSNCTYCGIEPKLKRKNKKDHAQRAMNGVDRIDSNQGYTTKNSTACCKKCNLMKHESSIEEWKEQMIRVLSYYYDKKL